MSRPVTLRDSTRLGVLFRKMILVTLVAPAAAIDACGTRESAAPEPDAGAVTSTTEDAVAAISADAESSDADAAPDPCAPVPYTGTDDAGTCTELAYYPCGLPTGIVSRGNCYFSPTDCRTLCPGFSFNCHTWDDSCFDGSVPESGPVTVDCVKCPNAAGRRPPGLRPLRRKNHASSVGAYFARAAHLEAASVDAFDRLHNDLAFYGAPHDLLQRTRCAKRDEERHAEDMSRLAARFGEDPIRPRVSATCHRDLEAIAVENMVEGCIRETFGALVATWQAEGTDDHEMTSVFASIADDETVHAALSWDIAAWLSTRLSADAQARVLEGGRAALRDLQRELAESGARTREDLAILGLPSHEQETSLFLQFDRFARVRLRPEEHVS